VALLVNSAHRLMCSRQISDSRTVGRLKDMGGSSKSLASAFTQLNS